jgi:glycerophosphoryl diester phosphodiesterase
MAFDLQGHRGARGLKPENTLPSFEVAFDLGVTSVETDVHLSQDGVPVLVHDPVIHGTLFRPLAAVPEPSPGLLVAALPVERLRCYAADRNPDPARFPRQDSAVTPLARLYADRHGLHPFTPPTLADLLDFALAYAGEMGAAAGKTDTQRNHARHIRFDLEIKRVPFRPEMTGDDGAAAQPYRIERAIVEVLERFGMTSRAAARSFDHRALRALRTLSPELTTAVLVAGTAPVAPAQLAQAADARVYCPDFQFLDVLQVRQLHAEGIRVVPWTVNEPIDWQRVLDWGVDGITTDYPDELKKMLERRARGAGAPAAGKP